jgi:hypothetical protein
MSRHVRKGLLAAAALSSLALSGAATAQTRDRAARELSAKYLTYYLPKAQIAAAVGQRLVRCQRNAQGAPEIEVETFWTLKARAVPDYAAPVTVDVSSGFLAARTVGMKFNPDGTLVSINAKSTGQGGEVLASVIKLAGTFAPLVAPIPVVAANGQAPAPQPLCRSKIVELLRRHAELAGKIDPIETAIAEGRASAEQKDLLDIYRQRLLAIEEGLTITGTADSLNGQVVDLEPCVAGRVCAPRGTAVIARFDYRTWFLDPGTSAANLPGFSYGFVARWAASAAAAASFAAEMGSRQRDGDLKQLVYLRPVPAVLIGTPCDGPPTGGQCKPDEKSPHASASLEFALPQLSPRFALPVGSAGIFGSREVAASFDSWGRPTELTYGSDPGGAAIAAAIDAVGETATSVRNAQLDAVNHAIAVEEAKAKLRSFTEE